LSSTCRGNCRPSYASIKARIVDPLTGEIIEVQLFMPVLGA